MNSPACPANIAVDDADDACLSLSPPLAPELLRPHEVEVASGDGDEADDDLLLPL